MLCKEIYHCTPLELDEQPVDQVLLHLTFYEAENKVKSRRQNAANKKKGKKGRKR